MKAQIAPVNDSILPLKRVLCVTTRQDFSGQERKSVQISDSMNIIFACKTHDGLFT